MTAKLQLRVVEHKTILSALLILCTLVALGRLPPDEHGTPLELSLLVIETAAFALLVAGRLYFLATCGLVFMAVTYARF